jgi:hypothetical protein
MASERSEREEVINYIFITATAHSKWTWKRTKEEKISIICYSTELNIFFFVEFQKHKTHGASKMFAR